MDRALSYLLIALACLTIRPDSAFARDCLQCWRDVCANMKFIADGPCSHNCCDCVDEESVADCIENVTEANNSQNCCNIAETNLLSVFSTDIESSDACDDVDSYLFHNLDEVKAPESETGTLLTGIYIVPSFVFECGGCIEEVFVRGIFDGAPPSHVTLQLMTWTQLNSTNDQDSYRLSHNVSVTTSDNNIERVAAVMQWTINFSLPVGDQLCFEGGEVLGFSFSGSNLTAIVVGPSEQSVYKAMPSIGDTCPNLDDLYSITTAAVGVVPLMAVRVRPPPTPSKIEITPSTPVPISSSSSTQMMVITSNTASPSMTLQPTSESTPTEPTIISTQQQTSSLPLIIGVIGGAVVLIALICIFFLALCIIQRQRHHNKVDGNKHSGRGITRVRSRRMERRLQSELLPAGERGVPFYQEPHTQFHQYHELEGPIPEHNRLTNVSSGNYTTMQPAGSVREGSITPVANGAHTVRTIYDDELADHDSAPRRAQDTPFYHLIEQPGQINGQLVKEVAEVGYDVPTELLRTHNNREEVVNPIYNVIEAGPQQHLQMVDPATGHPYHMLEQEESVQVNGRTERGAIEECGVYVPTAEERRRISDKNNTTELTASDLENWIKKNRLESTKKRRFFESISTYWDPPSDADNLYNTLAKRKYREILSDQIQIVKYIGHGQFGTVNLAVWTQQYVEPMEVAVKVCRAGANEAIKTKFLKEAAIMGQFHHPNVVKLYGVVTMSERPMIVIELLKNGDLLSYMEKFFEVGKMPPPSPLRLLSFCQQVASGMDYLSNKAFVHRDLAARNILLNELHQCKIGDFGMARDLENSEYYIMSRRGPMPLKWTAPEALNYRKYSTFSDCYSYGMVLYEIWSVGREPLPGISIKEVPDLVTNGFCQAPPPGCPRAIYELMVKLWNPKKRQRPPFSAIVQYLQQPDEQLLAWSEEDQIVSSQVTVLGAPLEEGKNLYPGLQNAYQSTWC